MSTRPKPFVFVLMPFSDSFDDVYEVAIQPACEAAGAYAERVDKQIFAGSIFDRVYNQIAKADVIVADMSERDPNVFYEVGYAHALGKTTILLTRDEADIPFDLRQDSHVVYRASLAKLKAELERRVRWHLENPTKIETAPQEVEVRVNGNVIMDRPTVVVRARGEPAALTLSVGLQNRAQKTVRTLSFRVRLFASPTFSRASDKAGTEYTSLQVDDRRLFMSSHQAVLLPEQWDVVDFVLHKRHDSVSPGETFDCTVRLYFDSGCADYPFALTVAAPPGLTA